jgi:glycyl-tRNA synthetase beta chain
MRETLLIELLTEELPPKSLRSLGALFSNEIFSGLAELGFLSSASVAEGFATPRRLGVIVTDVADKEPEKEVMRKGPSLATALNEAGEPTQALLGFAKSCGVGIESLQRATDTKGEFFVFRAIRGGQALHERLRRIVEAALKRLPVAKLMRWGESQFEFARPVRNVVMLHGRRVVEGNVFGITSNRSTHGHRFLSKNPLLIPEAGQYEAVLEEKGNVIPSFEKRFQITKDQLRNAASDFTIGADDDLIEEVTALVEYPVAYVGAFDPEFLELPQECLVVSMKEHQRYFPLLSRDGKLLPRFLTVSNIATATPQGIIQGNERVLRARLSDAKFFYEQDRKTRLDARVPRLTSVVFHSQIGSQLARVLKIRKLAGEIAKGLGAAAQLAERAAYLCKADLLSDMVGEFPELQGVMGRYYALHDNEPEIVAQAIEDHYRPRFAGDALPSGPISAAVALADKLNTLVGFFQVGLNPSGDKDPFGLRRQALGVIRILCETSLPLCLDRLLSQALAVQEDEGVKIREAEIREKAHGEIVYQTRKLDPDAVDHVYDFLVERLRAYLRDAGYKANEIESVLSLSPTRLDLILRQLAAVRAFTDLPEAQSLAAANKRVVNILKQAQAKGESFVNAEGKGLTEPAERALFDALKKTSKQAASLFEQGDFTGYLKSFAVLKSPVDAFFDSVMVMVEDQRLRQNRLALLSDLRREMNRVADISKLAA